MSTPHRATPEQWVKCEQDARLWSGAFNCILELRDRVEALEAAQQIRVFSAEEVAPIVVTTAEARPTPEGVTPEQVERYIEWATNEAGPWCTDDWFDRVSDHIRDWVRVGSDFSPSTPTPEARPAERLWERMEEAGRRELHDNPHAEQAEFYQAMLRAVAAWLRTGRLLHAAELLEQEADR